MSWILFLQIVLLMVIGCALFSVSFVAAKGAVAEAKGKALAQVIGAMRVMVGPAAGFGEETEE